MLGLWFAFIAVLLLNYLSWFFIMLTKNKEYDENVGETIAAFIFIVTYIAILVLGCVLFGLNVHNLV